MRKFFDYFGFFKRNAAVESEIDICNPETKEILEGVTKARTLELELNGERFFVFYGVYKRTNDDTKLVEANKDFDNFIDDRIFKSYLNKDDKSLIKRLVMNNFDLNEFVDFKQEN